MTTETRAFSDIEIEYLTTQPLCRLATVGADGNPHVVPVGFFYDPATGGIVIGGLDLSASKKFRDVRKHPAVALVVDDLADTEPWTPRGIEIRGDAEVHDRGGEDMGRALGATFPFSPAWIRVRPKRVVAWGLGDGPFAVLARDVG